MYYQSVSNDACYIWTIEAHEATTAAIIIIKIEEIMRENPDYFVGIT